MRLEAYANLKHEYLDGHDGWRDAGAARIASAVIGALGAQLLERPCAIYSSDARVRVVATGLTPTLTSPSCAAASSATSAIGSR